jgi:two-component system OmpR family sensor kinase
MSAGGAAGWSLGGRLARRVLLATSLLWCLSLAIGFGVMWHEMGEYADDAVDLRARTILVGLERGLELDLSVSEADGDELVTRLYRPGVPPTAAPWPPLAADSEAQIHGWAVSRRSTPGGYAVEVGQPATARVEEFIEAARIWLVLTVPLLALLLPVIVGTVRRALTPVVDLAREMDGRRASDLSPMPVAGLPAELLPIPRALNLYLARIEALLRSERAFSANVAHELRTPLASASAQARLIIEGRAGPEAPAAVLGAIARLTATVERLLDLAWAETLIGQGDARSDLVRVSRLLIAERRPARIHFDDGDLETCEVAADADAVALVLGNLLRNAVEHGAGDVRVILRPGPKVEISNAAPVGARFEETRFALGAGSTGSGLGLSLARAVAERYAWRLDLAMRDGRAVAVVDFTPEVHDVAAGPR